MVNILAETSSPQKGPLPNFAKFSPSMSFCIEEYIEASVLCHYLATGSLISSEELQKIMWEDVQSSVTSRIDESTQTDKMCEDIDTESSDTLASKETKSVEVPKVTYPIFPITLDIYLLGLLDVFGELTRMSMNPTITLLQIKDLRAFVQELFLFTNDTCRRKRDNNFGIYRKLSTAERSLSTIDQTLYRWFLRSAEFPDYDENAVRKIIAFKHQTNPINEEPVDE